MDRLTIRQVSKRLGICKGRILRELVRHDLLPYPDGGTWAEEDVAALERRWAERRAHTTQKNRE